MIIKRDVKISFANRAFSSFMFSRFGSNKSGEKSGKEDREIVRKDNESNAKTAI